MNNKAQFTPGPTCTCEIVMRTGETLDSSLGDRPCSDISRIVLCPLHTAAPALYEALQNLLEWAKGNRGAREGNPYCKPEVRQALKVLASIQDKKDYIDADTAPQAEGR